MSIIDTHLHLSPAVSSSAIAAARSLEVDLIASGVDRAVVLHLLAQPWSVEEFAEAMANTSRLRGFINIDPFAADAGIQLRDAVEKLNFIGLKLHPRLQKFSLDDPAVSRLVACAGELGIPVLIDAFPDGDWLMMGFNPLAFAALAKACPQTRIIIGHFGGHHCLDFMMLAKRIPNIWFDLSYSLLYYEGSSVTANLLYCCRSMRFQRIFYGSDYPDRSIENTVLASRRILKAHGICGDDADRLMSGNAKEFFGWTDI